MMMFLYVFQGAKKKHKKKVHSIEKGTQYEIIQTRNGSEDFREIFFIYLIYLYFLLTESGKIKFQVLAKIWFY